MEVVINRCFGGFGLSREAAVALIERDSEVIEIMDEADYFGEKGFQGDRTPGPDGFYQSQWSESVLMKDGKVFRPRIDMGSDEYRSHPDLVAVVRELGERASAALAELHIVQIPDGTKFVIEEYDGLEHVAEQHRTWS